MRYVISGTDFKQVDKYTIDTVGIPSLVLMERAALSVAEEVIKCTNHTERITAVCGIGNNGADGVAAARILCNRGYDTCVYFIGSMEKATEEFKKQISIYEIMGGRVLEYNGEIQGDVIIDAIFGIGLSRNVEGKYKDVIECINGLEKKVFAVDIPSGVNADTGKIMGECVRADVTVTFGMKKLGHIFYPGADYSGKVVVSEIGFPEVSYCNLEHFYILENDDFTMIPKRENASNKGTYGKVLVVAGNDDMSGAAFMCAKSCLRMGAGMVKVFTTKGNENLIKTMLPEAMVSIYNEHDYKEKLQNNIEWCDVAIVGPGMGMGKLQNDIVRETLNAQIPTVIDADGINCLSMEQSLRDELHKNVVITPHIGEMARFTGISVNDIKNDLISIAKEYAKKYNITIVLKDARTIISNGKKVYINTNGNNGMSTAGSGDVLAGIIGAFLARKVNTVEAGAVGVYVHGMAGDMAAKKISKTALIATDIIEELTDITKIIEKTGA